MQKIYSTKAVLALLCICLLSNCTKLDTTQQGSDVLEVDNINTFEEILPVETEQGIFGSYPGSSISNPTDSAYLRKNENHAIGNFSDPGFATTNARIFLQLKPQFFPYYFGNAGDTTKFGTPGSGSGPVSLKAGLDSVFLCLSYRAGYGDTSINNASQTFEVRQIWDSDRDFFRGTDSIYALNTPVLDVYPPLLGSATIDNKKIQEYFYFKKSGGVKDSLKNQIRIKLSLTAANNLLQRVYNADSILSSTNNRFYNDSVFRENLRGFEVSVTGAPGNTLYYVNLADVNTNLEFHYRKTKAGTGVEDTTVEYMYFYPQNIGNIKTSSSLNKVVRTYSPAVLSNLASSNTQHIYMGSTQSTFAKVKIPGLSTLSNRIVHRAYLIAEQDDMPAPINPFYEYVPRFLYIDLKDPTSSKYKPLYYDLSNQTYNPDDATQFFPRSGVNFNVFNAGAATVSNAGGTYTRYEIEVTRYVQNIVSNGLFNHEMRMYAPYTLQYGQYGFFGSADGTVIRFPYANPLAFGSVKLGGGANTNGKKMRLRVIYSKLKQ
jgi:hypothetical protein